MLLGKLFSFVGVRSGDQCLIGDSATEVTSSPVSTWMGDRQGRLSAMNLCPSVGVDLNLVWFVNVLLGSSGNATV